MQVYIQIHQNVEDMFGGIEQKDRCRLIRLDMSKSFIYEEEISRRILTLRPFTICYKDTMFENMLSLIFGKNYIFHSKNVDEKADIGRTYHCGK